MQDPSFFARSLNRRTLRSKRFNCDEIHCQLSTREICDDRLALRDSSKTAAGLTFRLSVAYLSLVASIFEHKRSEGDTFIEGLKGEVMRFANAMDTTLI
jgi:hypothetical protein